MYLRSGVAVVLLILPLLAVPSYLAGASQYATSLESIRSATNCINITFVINITSQYMLYGKIDNTAETIVNITVGKPPPEATVVEVKVPCPDWSRFYVEEIPEGGFYEIALDERLQPYARFVVPVSEHIVIRYRYVISCWSIMFRNYYILDTRASQIESNLPEASVFTTYVITLPSACYILPGYPHTEPASTLTYFRSHEGVLIEGYVERLEVVYESSWRIPVGVALCVLWVVIALSLDYLCNKAIILTEKLHKFRNLIYISSEKWRHFARWVVSHRGSVTILAALLLLTVLLSVVIGSPPRPSLVIVATPSSTEELQQKAEELGFSCISFYEDRVQIVEFIEERLVDVVLIGPMPELEDPLWTQYLNAFVKFLRRGGVIAVLAEYAERGLGRQLMEVLGECDRLVYLPRVEDLPILRALIQERPRVLALSPILHVYAIKTVAMLSALSIVFTIVAGVLIIRFFARRAGTWSLITAHVVAILIVITILITVHVVARIVHSIDYYMSLKRILAITSVLAIALAGIVLHANLDYRTLLRVILSVGFVLTAVWTVPHGDAFLVYVSRSEVLLTPEVAILRASQGIAESIGMYGLPIELGVVLWVLAFALVPFVLILRKSSETLQSLVFLSVLAAWGLAIARSVGVSFLAVVCSILPAMIVAAFLQLLVLSVDWLWKRYKA